MSQQQILVWVMDSDADAASFLCDVLASLALGDVAYINDSLSLTDAVEAQAPTLCILNYYAGQAGDLDKLALLKLLCPTCQLMVLVASGLAHTQLQQWQHKHAIDCTMLDKPLQPQVLRAQVINIIKAWQDESKINATMNYLQHTQPSGKWLELARKMQPGQAILSEITILITDIRHSTQRIVQQEPYQFLRDLNAWLALQTKLIYTYEGVVIKYTGDGVLAIFEGQAQNVLAMKCALQILAHQSQTNLPTGIGIANGLVLAGLIGSADHHQLDVTGQSVHLAARLCGEADAWQIVAERKCLDNVDMPQTYVPHAQRMRLRGFEQHTDMVVIKEKKA